MVSWQYEGLSLVKERTRGCDMAEALRAQILAPIAPMAPMYPDRR